MSFRYHGKSVIFWILGLEISTDFDYVLGATVLHIMFRGFPCAFLVFPEHSSPGRSPQTQPESPDESNRPKADLFFFLRNKKTNMVPLWHSPLKWLDSNQNAGDSDIQSIYNWRFTLLLCFYHIYRALSSLACFEYSTPSQRHPQTSFLIIIDHTRILFHDFPRLWRHFPNQF